MDKIALKNKIRELVELTNDEKAALIGLLNHQKKYGLVWEDKPEEVEEKLRDELPVLKEVKERFVSSDTPDAPNHILIEGDNLEALTALSYTHAGKIDMIYIDPPYNTGNKDFVYNDSYVDTEDSFRHSKWLSFMDKRLKIAKQLLSDKGVIFISIDDNEQAQLKLLCDEVFGENNFITNIVWQSTAGSNTGNEIVTTTEYVLVYTKNRQKAHFDGQPPSDDSFKFKDEYYEERGKYALDKLDRRRVGGHYSEALNFPVSMPDGSLRYPGGGTEYNEGWNYLWSKTKIQWGVENDFIVYKKNKDGWALYCKRYKKVDNTNKPIDKTTPYRNLISSDLFNTAQGTSELASIFDKRLFAFPKPSSFVKFLLSTTVFTLKNSTILDFFAGSGTTLHATMQLNKEDGGHRKCILVTNNENGICENMTYERNKRVINGYIMPKGEKVEGLKANNLRYYKTDFIRRDQSVKNMRALMAASTDLLCIKNDVYAEATFAGKKLNARIARYFESRQTRMLIIYDERAIAAIAELLQTMPLDGRGKIKVYTFAAGRYAYDDDFVDVADKVELCALPAAIYDAYQQVLPKRKPQYLPEALTENETEEGGAQ